MEDTKKRVRSAQLALDAQMIGLDRLVQETTKDPNHIADVLNKIQQCTDVHAQFIAAIEKLRMYPDISSTTCFQIERYSDMAYQ
jgi:DNA repair ATPase RecN